LLGYCTIKLGDPKYLDAWAESYRVLTPGEMDHAISAALQFLPWLQAKLWNATLSDEGISIRPLHFGSRTPLEARIMTPEGEVPVSWNSNGTIDAPKSLEVPA
jgi:hypothetical protein